MIDVSNVKYSIIPLSKKVIDDTLALKIKVFKDVSHPSKMYNMVLKDKLLNDDYVVFVATYNDEIIGCSYVTNVVFNDEAIILIEYLFVEDEYQHLGIGRNLLKFVLNNKKALEDIFSLKFSKCIIGYAGKDKEDFYRGSGFEYNSNEVYMSRRV